MAMNRHSSVKLKARPETAESALPAATPTFFTRYVREDASVAAPACEVWRWFTDFESFPSWNPFIRKAEGPLRVGAKLSLRLRLGQRIISFRPEVTLVEPAREVRWKTRVLVPGLFDVDRRFRLDPSSAEQTTFVQEETNSGLLVPIAYALGNLERDLRTGFRDFSQALSLQVAARRARANGAPAASRGERAGEGAPNHAVHH
jgi:hypothetical protein